MASYTLNYNMDITPLPIYSIPVSIKTMSGDIIPMMISSDITVKQFYEWVWKRIPERIALQCLDLFRMDSEEPLLPLSTPLYPQRNEVFHVSMEIHPHLSIHLDFKSNAYDQDKLYESFEVLIYICFPTQLESIEENISQRKINDAMYYHPTDQDGRPIPHGARHKANLYRFFARDEMIDNTLVTTFYSANNVQFIQPIIGGAEYNDKGDWMITINENTQRLEKLGDIFKDLLPASKKEKAILSQALEDKWAEMAI